MTRLDRVGLPVWQAVRPTSRALSVHQGKGLTDEPAQIGALLEAFESDCAERFDAEGPYCSWRALSDGERPVDLDDFAQHRSMAGRGDTPIRWAAAERLDGRTLFVPFLCVSLDLTRDLDGPFDRSSNGVATGDSIEAARLRALCELIEHDAVVEWREAGPIACTFDRIDPRTIPYGWFGALSERSAQAGASLRCYRAPSLTGTPVIVCEAADLGKNIGLYAAVWGSGCDPDPQIALLRAVAEALQSRVTVIAGTREDFPPSRYQREGAAIAFGLPLPPTWPGLPWDSVRPGTETVAGMAEMLAVQGCDTVAFVELGRSDPFVAVRAFAPGLGGFQRRRRAA